MILRKTKLLFASLMLGGLFANAQPGNVNAKFAGVPITLSTSPTLTFSNNTGFSDNIAQDGEGGSVNISDFDIQIYPINNAAEKLIASELEYHDGTQNGWTGYPAIITYGNVVANYGWVIKNASGNDFSLKSLSFFDWGEYSGDNFIVEGFNNGSSKGSIVFVGNTNGDLVQLTSSELLVSKFGNVDEVRVYKQGGADFWGALNNIKVSSPVVPTPVLTSFSSLSTFTTCSGKASVSQTFTVAGSDLTNDIVINAPTGFEISTVEASGYASSVTLTQVAGVVSSTTIYARLASNATGNPSGDISISSTGAAPSSLGINGTVIVTPMAPETQGDSVCDNGTLTLMAKLAENRTSGQLYSIKWYDASTNGTLVHTGSTFVTGTLNSSTYYYALVEVSGCESPRTSTLALVTATPEKPYISTAGPQCKEGSFTFNALMPVKINCRNCGDDNIYLWKNSKGDSVFNDADFTTPILKSTETYTVTAEMNGCISQPTIVNAVILNIPTPKVLSINPVCSGNTTTISVETISAGRISGCRNCGELYDYTWYNVNGDSIGTGSSFNTQSMLFNTKFYVKASDNGCYSDSSEINVYVIDKPEISQELIDLTICNGSIAKFKVASDGENLNYNWGMTDGTNWMIEPSETKDSVEFEVDGGLDGVKIFTIVSNTCGKDTSLANLSVMVVDTAVSVQNGIISANIADEEYQWVNMDTKSIIDGETNRAYSPTKTGTYAVVIKQYFGKGRYCTDTSGYRYVEVVATGLENSIVSNFSIYPNPATDNVTISLTESVSGTVSIVDLHGNVVATKSISGNTSNISTSELASGVYVVKINSDKGSAVKQLVIQ